MEQKTPSDFKGGLDNYNYSQLDDSNNASFSNRVSRQKIDNNKIVYYEPNCLELYFILPL